MIRSLSLQVRKGMRRVSMITLGRGIMMRGWGDGEG